MFKQNDFENIIFDFLFTYRQFLLNGFLHERVTHDMYETNIDTWNTILLSLETGAILGLARMLERDDDFGRIFNEDKLNIISKKIMKIRHAHMAHNDLSKKRNQDVFLRENQLTGSDLVAMFDALKNRAIQYQTQMGLKIDVQNSFTQSQNNALNDLGGWLRLLKK